MDYPSIEEEEIEWQETGPSEDPKGRLLASIRIAGVPMHLEAYALVEEDGIQQFRVWREEMTCTFAAFGVEGAWHTLEIDGTEYALIATPFVH